MAENNDSVLAQLQAAIAAGPTGGTTPARRPIGVPQGFTTPGFRDIPNPDQFGPGNTLRVPAQLPPRYFDGDEFIPASLSPERIASLQSSLARAGLIGKKDKFRVGVWDATSARAYRQALETANASGLTDQEALARYANAQQAGLDDDETRAPLVKRLPNPADLRATFQTVARNTLGRGADPQLVEQMVNSYTQAVGNQQQATYDTQTTGGTVTEAPAAEVFAEQQIRDAQPSEAGAHDIALRYGKFLRMLGPAGGALNA